MVETKDERDCVIFDPMDQMFLKKYNIPVQTIYKETIYKETIYKETIYKETIWRHVLHRFSRVSAHQYMSMESN